MKYIKSFFSLFYILVCVFLAIFFSVIFRSRLLLLTGCCTLIFVVLDVLFFALFSRFVSFSVQTDSFQTKKGDSFRIVFTAKNFTPVIISFLAVKFSVQNFYFAKREEEITLALGAFSKKKLEIPVKCTLNGNVRVSADSVVMGDFLGLMSRNIPCDDVCTVAVLPFDNGENRKLPQTGVSDDDLQIDETKAYSGDMTGVREYIPGDKLNNIHWKLSAANENADFLVKEFSESLNDAVVVVFEYCKKNVDAVIDSVFAVSRNLLDTGLPFKLLWVNGGCEDAIVKNIAAAEDFEVFVDELYTSYPNDVPTAAIDSFKTITGTQNCIYITCDGIVK